MHMILWCMAVQGLHHVLMFGHHPRLAIDAFLGILQDIKTTRSHSGYVDILKQRLDAAYVIASNESTKQI